MTSHMPQHHPHSRYAWLDRKIKENRKAERASEGKPNRGVYLKNEVYPEYNRLAREKQVLDRLLVATEEAPFIISYQDKNNRYLDIVYIEIDIAPDPHITYPTDVSKTRGTFSYNANTVQHMDEEHRTRMTRDIVYQMWRMFLAENKEFQKHVDSFASAMRIYTPCIASQGTGVGTIFTFDQDEARAFIEANQNYLTDKAQIDLVLSHIQKWAPEHKSLWSYIDADTITTEDWYWDGVAEMLHTPR